MSPVDVLRELVRLHLLQTRIQEGDGQGYVDGYYEQWAAAWQAARECLSSPGRAQAVEDTRRLDYLDRMNAALNKRYGTNYGWQLILSPNVVRLMMESPFVSEMALIDLHDSEGSIHKLKSCRDAIDDAMRGGRE